MKNKNVGMLVLGCSMVLALAGFLALYFHSLTPVEDPMDQVEETSALEAWTQEESAANGAPIRDNKAIYTRDNSLYDVYISVFPTKDENGQMLDFSAFELHHARDHSYNPTLNCNIQILPEGEKPDPLVSLDKTNASIRVRGNSSRGDKFKSYKVKLKDGAEPFFGQTSLNINKHSEDEHKVTTKFCTDILQEIPSQISFRTNFMRVWIRDTSLPEDQQEFRYYGLFTNTEQPNKKFLESRGLSPNCVMYKARDFYFQQDPAFVNVDDPAYDQVLFEERLGIREGQDHTKLLHMLEVVNDETLDIMDVIDQYFNEENYLDWLAFNFLVGADDVLNHNYLLYSPNNSQTWYFFTWDYDSNMPANNSRYIPESLRGGQKMNLVSFHRRYFRVPGNLEKLQDRMQYMLEHQFSPENIQSITSGYMPVLEKTMMYTPDVTLLRCAPNDLPDRIRQFPQIIQRNYNNFVTAFNYPAPMFVSAPERNPEGGLDLSWNSSYSYQGRTITYKVQIANDCHMNNLLYEEKDIINTYTHADLELDPGTYYLKVFAVDSEGNEQVSLEHYEFMGEHFIYESGVLEFTLD